MVDAIRRYRLAPLLAIVLMALLVPGARGAIVFQDRFGKGINDPAVDIGGLRDPQDVTVDTEGDIYVVDQHYHRVQKYNAKGEFLMSIGKPSTDGTYTQDGQLQHPQSIAVNPEGTLLYVADTSNSRVQVFSTTDGSFVFKWGEGGVGEGQLNAPGGIDVDAQGNVWVADTRNHRVQKFSPTGTFIDEFGSLNTTEGGLVSPVGIVVAESIGKVYVTDEYTGSIAEFTTAGAFVALHGVDEAGGSIYKSADEITFDETTNTIYVIEAGDAEVSMLDATKPAAQSFITSFMGTDTPSSDYGFSPHGIFLNQENGELLVAAGGANGKKIYRYDTDVVPKLFAELIDIDDGDFKFQVSHDAMVGSCFVKGTGTLKTPKGDTFKVRGTNAVLPAKKEIKYFVVAEDRAARRAIRNSKVSVTVTFRSPGGCNNGLEQPEPFTVKFNA